MIGEQIQINSDGTATVACKVPATWVPLLNLIVASRESKMNNLLKMCLHFIIETAKITTAPSPEMRALLNMMKMDANWASMFNYVENGEFDVAQCILVLQQSKDGKPREGYGLAMFNKPFMGEGYQTLSKDEILERVVEVTMGQDDYQKLRDIGEYLCTGSIRETLSCMIDAQTIENLNASDRDELPGYGEFHDFGKMLKYGEKFKRKPHRTPDSLANSKQLKLFDSERPYGEQADEYLRDLEELERAERSEMMEKDLGFKPFDQEA